MFFYNWSPATWKTQKLASHMVPHGPMGLSLLEISQLRHGSVHLFDVDLWDHLGLGQSWEQNWIKLGQRCEASWIIYDALFGVAESTGISHDWTHPLASCKAPEKALKNKAKAQSKLPLFWTTAKCDEISNRIINFKHCHNGCLNQSFPTSAAAPACLKWKVSQATGHQEIHVPFIVAA